MGNEISDNTINNKCSKCCGCCAPFIPFTNKEVKLIKQYVKKHKIPLKNRNMSSGDFDGTCCFWDNNSKMCLVYEVRPFVCRHFMCNNKNWLQDRENYNKRSTYNKWNSTSVNLYSFDDLIYGDPTLTLTYIFDMCSKSDNGVEPKDFINTLKYCNREDLLEVMTIKTDDNKEISCKDFL